MLLAAGPDGLLVEAQQVVEGEEHTQERSLPPIELLHAKPVGGEVVLQLLDTFLNARTLAVVASYILR